MLCTQNGIVCIDCSGLFQNLSVENLVACHTMHVYAAAIQLSYEGCSISLRPKIERIIVAAFLSC